MRRFAIPLLAALAALSAAPAQAGRHHRTTTFTGSCHFAGTVTFRPPLTNTPRQGSGFARARGTCNGRPARYVAWNSGVVSCGQGSATGAGYLLFGHGRRLRFRLTEQRVTGAAALHLEGARGGTADGVAAISQSEDPVAIAQACLGAGLSRAKVDIDLTASAISG
jgi:hypothetical protein